MCSSLYSFSAAPKKNPPPADGKSDEHVDYLIVANNEYGDGMTENIPLTSFVWKDGKRVVVDHTNGGPVKIQMFGLTSIGQPGLRQLLTPPKQSKPTASAASAMPEITDEEREAMKKALAKKKKYYERTQNTNTPPS